MQRIAVRNGIDNLQSADKLLRGKRLGLATNPTGVGRELNSTADILRERYRLVALYGPEHGIRGDAQAGDKVGSTVDERTGLPMHSLYGASRHLTHETAASLDAMVFDMQDIGVRLGVDAIVTGRLWVTNDNVIVATKVIRASDARELWTAEFVRPSAGMLELQHDMAAAIADALNLRRQNAGHHRWKLDR